MSSWAKPGVKCVCIDAVKRNRRWRGIEIPVEGQVYTVRDVLVTPTGKRGVYLEELVNPLVWIEAAGRKMEWCFGIERFRPVVVTSQEQDVAMFEHHLTSAPAPELVE